MMIFITVNLTIFNEVCKINNNNNPEIQDDMIEKIKKELANKDLDKLLENVTDGEKKKDLLIKAFNVIYLYLFLKLIIIWKEFYTFSWL